jgi:hypothetical protein
MVLAPVKGSGPLIEVLGADETVPATELVVAARLVVVAPVVVVSLTVVVVPCLVVVVAPEVVVVPPVVVAEASCETLRLASTSVATASQPDRPPGRHLLLIHAHLPLPSTLRGGPASSAADKANPASRSVSP